MYLHKMAAVGLRVQLELVRSAGKEEDAFGIYEHFIEGRKY